MQKLAVFLATASMAVSLFTFFQSRTTPADNQVGQVAG